MTVRVPEGRIGVDALALLRPGRRLDQAAGHAAALARAGVVATLSPAKIAQLNPALAQALELPVASAWSRRPRPSGAVDQVADAGRVEGHAIHARAEGPERVLDGAGHGGGDGEGAGLARALDAEGIDGARRGQVE